jgi:hypothetical protein
MMETLRAYGLKIIEALYRTSVASVLAFCGLLLLMAIIAIALQMKAIDVQQIHTAQ